jgi:hypothetical protein
VQDAVKRMVDIVVSTWLRSLVTVSCLVVLTLGCDTDEPSTDDPAPAPTPSPTAPASIETPTAPVIAAPVVPAPSPAPTPVDVCRNVRAVGSQDQPAANLLDEVEHDCVAAFEHVRTQYDALATCLLGVHTASDVAACERGMGDWTGLLSKADPRPTAFEACNHIMEMMKRDFNVSSIALSDANMAKFREQCVEALDEEEITLGAEKYDARIACIIAAKKMEDVRKCEKTEPDAKPTSREICIHMMGIMKRQFVQLDLEASDAEMAKFQHECVEDLDEQQEKLGSERFDARVACIMKTETFDGMVTCENSK